MQHTGKQQFENSYGWLDMHQRKHVLSRLTVIQQERADGWEVTGGQSACGGKINKLEQQLEGLVPSVTVMEITTQHYEG